LGKAPSRRAASSLARLLQRAVLAAAR
jgi:hypothetical protein